MRVAVIGGGISGIAAATTLHEDEHVDVVLFEGGRTLGGHAHTVTVDLDGDETPLDVGFMVFNDRTYPTFVGLLDRWGVASRPSTMSFGVSDARSGLEYSGRSVSAVFAQRRTLADPAHWRMLGDVVRFGKAGRDLLRSDDHTTTIGDFLRHGRWSGAFVDRYLLPLGSAIWSCGPGEFDDFPARALCGFLDNHGLLTLTNRPRWHTVVGGSRRYVEAAAALLGDRVRVATPVAGIARDEDGVTVATAHGRERFDQVVLALHADDALDLLVDASPEEKDVLGAFPYAANDVVLHHDRRMLPRERRAWASWNYHRPPEPSGDVQVTYHLNRLQGVTSRHELCVTLNRTAEIDPARILWRSTLRHPVYRAEAFAAHGRWSEVSGVRRTHYCGAYWGWGFHEDGAASGVRAARSVLHSR